MPWMATLLAALALHCVASVHGGGNRFAAYNELTPPALPKRCLHFQGLRDCPEEAAALQPEAIDPDDISGAQGSSTSKMLNALFGLVQSTTAPHSTETALTPHQLPPMYYNDFYEDLLTSKRNDVHSAGCDCKVMNDLIDLGSMHFPRFLMSAVCESQPALDAKCTHGSNCKPLEYKVKVLTPRAKGDSSSPTLTRIWLPEDVSLSWQWHFKTVTVTAGCFCTI